MTETLLKVFFISSNFMFQKMVQISEEYVTARKAEITKLTLSCDPEI